MKIHVSLRRMILGILIRIFPPKNPDIRAIIARAMTRFFRIFCVFQRGTRAHILIQTFPTWYVVLLICTGIPIRIMVLTERADETHGIIIPIKDEVSAVMKIRSSIDYFVFLRVFTYPAKFSLRKSALPETRISAPDSMSRSELSIDIPPSTSMRKFALYCSLILFACCMRS